MMTLDFENLKPLPTLPKMRREKESIEEEREEEAATQNRDQHQIQNKEEANRTRKLTLNREKQQPSLK